MDWKEKWVDINTHGDDNKTIGHNYNSLEILLVMVMAILKII